MLNAPILKFKYTVLWDPTEPVATQPLALLKGGLEGTEYWTSGHDFTKNVTELFDREGHIAHTYDYSPYGQVIAETSDEDTLLNPFQWSSEHRDRLTELVYYNFRYYNPYEGRWTSRDPLMEAGGYNLYDYVANSPSLNYDYLGLKGKLPLKPGLNDILPELNVGKVPGGWVLLSEKKITKCFGCKVKAQSTPAGRTQNHQVKTMNHLDMNLNANGA